MGRIQLLKIEIIHSNLIPSYAWLIEFSNSHNYSKLHPILELFSWCNCRFSIDSISMVDQYSISIFHLSLLMILVELCIIIVRFYLEFSSCHLCLYHLHRLSLRVGFIPQLANRICLKHYLLRLWRLGVSKLTALISQQLLKEIKIF